MNKTNSPTILMVSDFFYPNVGGVESHIYSMSQCLMDQGHKVVVATHAYGDCRGVRYLTNGLKVYYLPRQPFLHSATLPTILGSLRLLRCILIRERIQLIHAHQAFSVMALEAVLHGRTLGLKVVFTDHSLFGFADIASIITNKVLKVILADVHAAICVSHTAKENTVLRACLAPSSVFVIPNAVDTTQFQPPDPVGGTNATAWPRSAGDPVTIVAMSRLVYRKGIDLLACVIPELCARHPRVRFIIGGDGPKRRLLQAMISEQGLQGRVEMVGAVAHEKARALLGRGHIFVNASLTEAFCISLVEAASVGLLVVSTRVGGVPEVLPDSMALLCPPSADGLLGALEEALTRVGGCDPQGQHAQVSAMYNWSSVATRTAAVYRHVLVSSAEAASPVHAPTAAHSSHDGTSSSSSEGSGSEGSGSGCRIISGGDLLARIERYMVCGMWVGALFSMFAVFGMWWAMALDAWLQPASSIEIAADWPRKRSAEQAGVKAGGSSRQDAIPGMTADGRHHCSGDVVKDG
ncbi:MAG: hypothetical protein WDW36_007499 [Sanguina aurantia]